MQHTCMCAYTQAVQVLYTHAHVQQHSKFSLCVHVWIETCTNSESPCFCPDNTLSYPLSHSLTRPHTPSHQHTPHTPTCQFRWCVVPQAAICLQKQPVSPLNRRHPSQPTQAPQQGTGGGGAQPEQLAVRVTEQPVWGGWRECCGGVWGVGWWEGKGCVS